MAALDDDVTTKAKVAVCSCSPGSGSSIYGKGAWLGGSTYDNGRGGVGDSQAVVFTVGAPGRQQ